MVSNSPHSVKPSGNKPPALTPDKARRLARILTGGRA